MKKFISLLEELSSYEKEYLRKYLGGNKYNPLTKHIDMFDSYNNINQNRIVLPLESSNLNDKVNPEIKLHLKKHGWDIHNYHAGLASRQVKDRDGNDKLEIKKIGKILQDTGGDKVFHTQLKDRLIKGSDGKPIVGVDGRYKSEKVPQTLSDFYNADKTRESVKSEHNIVISRDLDDIGGMTSGRHWSDDSCMRLPNIGGDEYIPSGEHHDKIKNDLKHGTLVAYATKRGDDDLEVPVGRVLIKRYKSTKKIDGEHHYIYRPENTTYGNVPDGFVDHVEEIMKKHYPAKPDINYSLEKTLYSDGRPNIEPHRVGLYNNGGFIKNYNSEGKLHDFIDEHGVKQPAVYTNINNYAHYKNGKLHNENGMAVKFMGRNSHYINGELHREGDLPAVYSDNGELEEYHIGGVLHRDGDKPAVTAKQGDTYIEQKFMKNGLLHREGDLPAHIVKSNNVMNESNIKVESYYKNGLLHRDGDKPADINIRKSPHESTTNIIYAKDGIKTKKEVIYENIDNDGQNEHTITTYDKHGEIEHSIKIN